MPLIDPRTGLIDRAWYLFFLSLNQIATGIIDDSGLTFSSESLIASYDAALRAVNQELQTLPPVVTLPVPDVLTDCCSALVSQMAEMQKQIDALNLLPPPAQGTVTAVTATAPVVSSGGTAPDISMPAANTTTNGYLTSTDWNTFNNKQSVAAPVTKTADFTVAATDLWLINNKSGSTCTVTLPTASSYSGRILHFQTYQAQTVVSASSNVVPQAGGSAGTSILLASIGDSATLVSDGTNWLMTQYIPNNALLLE
ncbi:MAG: hypothetical protein EBS36_06895 [Actinobacteria bacterium]|nr:hypothetical protein [Actinomycetota bacterium]